MFTQNINSLLITASIVPLVLGHGWLQRITIDGAQYQAWAANASIPYPNTTPAWFTSNYNGGARNTFELNTPNIICGKDASPANISVPVQAGHEVRVQWGNGPQGWVYSHWGPILSYIAACPSSGCTHVDKTTLKWVKIGQTGFINYNYPPEGTWASNALIADDSSWNIKIPPQLAAGEYVLRNELIALHVADYAIGASPYAVLTYPGSPDSFVGAEFYPTCINLKVTGNGKLSISGLGTDARTFYKGNEPMSLAIDIHNNTEKYGYTDLTKYVFPGPPVWSGVNAKRAVDFQS